MRIGIDIRSLQNDSQLRGIGTYTACLVESMLSVDRENEYVFFAFGNRPLPDLVRRDVFQRQAIQKVTNRKKRFVWLSGQLFFPYTLQKEKIDIFHAPEYIVPVFARAKKVITVHDFINTDYPFYGKRCGLLRRLYFYLKDKTLLYADKIIAVSEYTKRKILELTDVKEDRIKVVYEAPGKEFHPFHDADEFLRIREKYAIKDKFLLYVGALDYHKNIENLIRAFSAVSGKDAQLLLCGVQHDPLYADKIRNLVKTLKIGDKVLLFGFVPKADLILLYNMAQAVVSVSVYEGFGLPIIEAMSCAKPVIASNNTSMAEFVGEGGILVDPYSIDQIAGAMDTLLACGTTRELYASKALRQSEHYSWEKAAQETLAVYKELVS